MKFKIIALVALAVILLPAMSEAQREPSNVRWQSSDAFLPTFSSIGGSGDTVEMRGFVSVDPGSIEPYNGHLKFRIWGSVPVGKNCNTPCGGSGNTCFDWEACGGQDCGEVCLVGEWVSPTQPGTNTICGTQPACLSNPICGESCTTMYAGPVGLGGGGCIVDGVQNNECEKNLGTINPGVTSLEVKFEKTIDSSWPDGRYVGILNVFDVQHRQLDTEFAYFTVEDGALVPDVDVGIIDFTIIAAGATAGILGAIFLFRRFA